MNTPQVFAFEDAIERVGGDREFLGELMGMFFSNWPQDLARLTDLVDSGDLTGVYRVAHSLKSSLGNLGTQTSMQLAFELERAGKVEDADSVRTVFRKLLSEV